MILEHNEDGTVQVSSNSHEAELIAVSWQDGTYTRVPVLVDQARVDNLFNTIPKKTSSRHFEMRQPSRAASLVQSGNFVRPAKLLCRVILLNGEDGRVHVYADTHEAELIAVNWQDNKYTRVPITVDQARVDDFFNATPRKTNS